MPSKTEWRELEQGIGRDAFKLDSTTRGGSAGMILCVWLAFYVLAVTHALLSQRLLLPSPPLRRKSHRPRGHLPERRCQSFPPSRLAGKRDL